MPQSDIKTSLYSVSTSNCHRQLRVRPRGVEINPLSVGELILELLFSIMTDY